MKERRESTKAMSRTGCLSSGTRFANWYCQKFRHFCFQICGTYSLFGTKFLDDSCLLPFVVKFLMIPSSSFFFHQKVIGICPLATLNGEEKMNALTHKQLSTNRHLMGTSTPPPSPLSKMEPSCMTWQMP